MIIQSISQKEFINAFMDSDMYRESFSRKGLTALYGYLNQLSDDMNEDVNLDIVDIACSYSEYKTAHECAENYFDYAGMIFDEEGDETMTAEEVEASAVDFLNDYTTVITFDGGVIIKKN